MSVVQMRVRRSLGGYAALVVLGVFAAAGGLGLVAMLVQGEAIAWVPGLLFIFSAFGLLAVGSRRLSIHANELRIGSMGVTRRVSIDAIVDVKAPSPQWIGWPIRIRIGYVSLEVADDANPIVFYCFFQRQSDLNAVRAELLAAAQNNVAFRAHRPSVDHVSPKAANVWMLSLMGLAALVGGIAMSTSDVYRGAILLLCGTLLLGITWVECAAGKASIRNGEVCWRTMSGRIQSASLAKIASVNPEQNSFRLSDGRRVWIHHGLATRGTTERFLEELQRQLGRTADQKGHGALAQQVTA